jgi:hypothetical protein
LSSGDQFFEGVWEPEPVDLQTQYIEQPVRGCTYTVGVDVASGSSDGDYSAAMVLDVTVKGVVRPVAWIYRKCPVHQFAKEVRSLAEKYHNALVVVEVNNAGIAVQEDLYLSEYPRLYRRYQYDKMAERYVEKLGFFTDATKRHLILNRMRKYVAMKMLTPLPAVLINEMSSFVYNEKGKPEHSQGCHDDMIIATALALEGIEQIGTERKQIFREFCPETPEEICAFETKTGISWLNMEAMGADRNRSQYNHLLGDNLDF